MLDFFDGLSVGTLLQAVTVVLVFIILLFVGSIVLPGKKITGPEIEGEARTYKLNGLILFLIVLIGAGFVQVLGLFSLSTLVDDFLELFIAANLFAFLLSGWLYWRGVRSENSPSGFWRGLFYGKQGT